MSEERNYKVQPMNSETLAHRRAHAQRNPWGNTAELVGHIDWQEAQIAALVEAARKCLNILNQLPADYDVDDVYAAIEAATAPEVKP